jgi:hypothetical protein
MALNSVLSVAVFLMPRFKVHTTEDCVNDSPTEFKMLFFKKKLIRHMTKPVNPDKDHFGL